MTQDATVPNGNYTLKAWVKSTGGQNSAMVYVRGYGGDDKIVNVNKKMDSWTQITIDNIPVTTGKVQIGVYSDAKAGNWLMVDDFTLSGSPPHVIPRNSAAKRHSSRQVRTLPHMLHWTPV